MFLTYFHATALIFAKPRTKMTLVCARSLRETLVVVLVLESKSSPFNIRLMIDAIQHFFFLTLAVLRSTQKDTHSHRLVVLVGTFLTRLTHKEAKRIFSGCWDPGGVL